MPELTLFDGVELVILGCFVGYFSGMFGVGGGFLLTPMLISIFLVNPTVAVASGLAQMIVLGGMAAWRHHRKGYVDPRAVLYMAPGALLGTMMGKGLLGVLERQGTILLFRHPQPFATVVLTFAFSLLLFWMAARSLMAARKDEPAAAEIASGPLRWAYGPLTVALPVCGLPRVSVVGLLLGGTLAGTLAGLLGVGGGVVVVPLLAYGVGISLRIAIGSSSLLILISAIAGTLQYAAADKIDWRLVAILLCGSLLGVNLGAAHSHRLPVKRLQGAFAALLVVVALVCLYRLWRP